MPTPVKKLPFHKKLKISMDGRTNTWLSNKTDIPQSEISRIINGKLTPSESQVEKIKAIFPDDLIDY